MLNLLWPLMAHVVSRHLASPPRPPQQPVDPLQHLRLQLQARRRLTVLTRIADAKARLRVA